MLPGKNFTFDEVIRILRRRLWFVLVPAAIVAAGVSMYARSLPDLYQSNTTILVIPQRISESIVRPTISTSIEARLPSISQAITSRTRLEALIEEFDLYRAERSGMAMETVVELMRGDIEMNPNSRQGDMFEIRYSGRDPLKVMQVTERLGSLAIEQSLSYRHNLAEDTDAFLDSQLADTRRQLEIQEQRLAAYQRTYAGELPSQVNSNLQQVTSANGRVQTSLDAVNRAMERRPAIEKMLADLETTGAIAPPPLQSGTTNAVVGTTLQQLGAAQDNLASLETRGLRPGHPDLEAARRQVRDLTQRLDAENRQLSASGAVGPRPVSAAEVARLARVKELHAELAELDRQIARSREEERLARAAAEQAQARLDALPTRESELVALTRDYGITEDSYRDLLAKRDAARISANLEQRQVGEQFNIVDRARVAERPFSPDRASLNLAGLAVGFGLGLALVALLEVRDRTFKTDEEITMVLGLPVLAVVPLMESERDRARGVWKRVGIGAVCATVVIGCVAVFVYAVAG